MTDLLEPIDRRTAIYCCGGDGFVTAVRTITQQFCFQNVHFEAFAGGVSAGRKGESFVADLPRSKHVLQVPEDKTLLEVLLSDGVDIDYACEAGVCRSCIVDVLEGDVIHHDQCLTDEERKTLMTPCVSRARGRLVINSL